MGLLKQKIFNIQKIVSRETPGNENGALTGALFQGKPMAVILSCWVKNQSPEGWNHQWSGLIFQYK